MLQNVTEYLVLHFLLIRALLFKKFVVIFVRPFLCKQAGTLIFDKTDVNN
jgi:hypothetical protein